MKMRYAHKEKQSFLESLPLIQLFITLAITIFLFYWERKNEQGYLVTFIFSVVGIYSSMQSFTIKKMFEINLKPLDKIKEIFDLKTDIVKFRELSDSYLRINESVFTDIKEEIIKDAVNSLKEISQSKTLMLTKSQFYGQIFQLLDLESVYYKKIWAVSMLLENEWVNDQYESKFLEANFRATDKNVVLERIFILPDDKIREILSNKQHPITRHFLYCPPCINEDNTNLEKFKTKYCKTCKVREKSNVRPYLVSVDFINKYQPELLKKSFGFIAFDDDLIFIDNEELDNEEKFSKISMSKDELSKAQELFTTLKRYQVEACKVYQR